MRSLLHHYLHTQPYTSDRLKANGYPRGVLLTLVDKALSEQLQWVPHRIAISRALPEIRYLVKRYTTLIS